MNTSLVLSYHSISHIMSWRVMACHVIRHTSYVIRHVMSCHIMTYHLIMIIIDVIPLFMILYVFVHVYIYMSYHLYIYSFSGSPLDAVTPLEPPRFNAPFPARRRSKSGNLMMVFSRMTVSMGSEASVLTEACN